MVLAALFVPLVLGALVGFGIGGLLGALIGAVAGFVVGLVGLAAVLTPWIERAVLAQHGVRVRGSRWRGSMEVWDLSAREVTTVRGRLRRTASVRRIDRRDAPPDPPRSPPYVPGLWPLPDDARDGPQVQKAVAKARRYRALAGTPEALPRRGR
jgi:hypothetical protein